MNRFCAAVLFLVATSLAAAAQTRPAADHYFTTSDNIHLHYAESGNPNALTIILVPGWTMPAWIFAPQIRFLTPHYHVIAFDPRGQGSSEIAPTGYNQFRRGQDIAELIAHLHSAHAVILGWSLGVLDTLAYIHQYGDAHIAGLVLVDNSVGENPPPIAAPPPAHPGPRLSHAAYMRTFVSAMFYTPQSPAYLNRLTQASLRLPEPDARALLDYSVPRSYWREGIFSTSKPVLYIVRPHLNGQAHNLLTDRPNTEIAIFPHAGHALFVDDAAQFNTLVAKFLKTQIKAP
jgi:microsomal epoxide hydrolase